MIMPILWLLLPTLAVFAQPVIEPGIERRMDTAPADWGVSDHQVQPLFQSKVHVFAWIESPPLGSNPGNIRVMARRDLAGFPIGEPVPVSTTQSNGGFSNLRLAARGFQVYAIWERVTRTDEEVFYELRFNRSMDGGLTWGQDRIISPPAIDVRNGFAVALGPTGHIYVAYSHSAGAQSGVSFRRSTDGGSTWSAPLHIDNSPAGAARPSIAADAAGRIVVVWRDGRPGIRGSLWGNSSADGGATFGNTDAFVAGLDGLNIKIVSGGLGRFYTTFEAAPVSRTEAYFGRSINGGLSWNAPVRVDLGALGIDFTSLDMTADSVGHIHTVASYELTNGNALVYRGSDDTGLTFRPPLRLDSAPSGTAVLFAKVAASSDGTVVIPWAQLVNGTSPGIVLAVASIDFGRTWSDIARLSGNADLPRFFPEITLDAGGAAVAWNQIKSPKQKLFFNVLRIVP